MNAQLRPALATSLAGELTEEQKKAYAAQVGAKKALKQKSAFLLPAIQHQYRWTAAEIENDSPTKFDKDDREGMFHGFLGLFEPEDIIWIGDTRDSGSERHRIHFQTASAWGKQQPIPIGPLTCPACFKPGCFSRSKEGVNQSKYLIVESDYLKKDEVGAIFCWLEDAVEMTLRAVVDTGGKSLHGWFDYPEADVLEELKIMLPAMKCDAKMFTTSQPCRLPGGLRDGKIQRLLYLNVGGQK